MQMQGVDELQQVNGKDVVRVVPLGTHPSAIVDSVNVAKEILRTLLNQVYEDERRVVCGTLEGSGEARLRIEEVRDGAATLARKFGYTLAASHSTFFVLREPKQEPEEEPAKAAKPAPKKRAAPRSNSRNK